MRRVHVIELAFKFESKLDFLLVILCVLRVVLLQLETHLLLIHHFSLKLLAHFLLRVKVLLEDLLVVGLLLRFFLVIKVQLLQLRLVLLRDLTDEHSIVGSTTVLKKDGEDFPNVGDHRVLLLRVLQTVFY